MTWKRVDIPPERSVYPGQPMIEKIEEGRGMMEAGITAQERDHRYGMLNHNMLKIMDRMTESGYESPVGLIIDTTDRYGSEIAKAVMEKEGIDYKQHVETCLKDEMIPTLLMVLPFDVARQLLHYTASNAYSTLSRGLPPDTYWIIVVGAGGNTYAGVRLPHDRQRGIKPGQHRV